MTDDTAALSPPPQKGILRRTADGAALMVAWRMVNRGLGLVSTLILVRLLTPEDFGLVTLAFSVAATLSTSSAIGVEAQIVRSRTASRALYDTGFTLNLLRGLLLGGLVFALAAPASTWFRDGRLLHVLQIIAIVPVLEGLMNVGLIEYKRQLRFDRDFWFLSITRTFQVVVTVVMAFVFRSYLAMLLGIVVGRCFAVTLSYAMHPYRPRLSFVARHELLGVSFWTWLINVAVVVRDRTDTFLIGRLLGMQAVGIYAVSVELAGLALTELVSPLAQVCMPGFAATLREANTSTVAAAFRRALAVTTAVAVPTGVGLSLVSEAVVLAGLGRGWMEAAGLIAVMAIAFIPIALGLIANSLLVAHAALQRLFAITAAAAAVRISVLIAIGARYGLLGIAVASCAVSVSEQAVLIGAAQRLVRLPAQGLLAAIWRPLLAAIVMAIALWQLGLGWLPAPPAEAGAAARLLGAAVPLGAATFTAVLALAWWVSGRPQGAESDLLAYLSKGAVGLRRRLAEGRPGRHARRREE